MTIEPAVMSALMCPTCRAQLRHESHELACAVCGTSWRSSNDKIYFRDVDSKNEVTDSVDRLKHALKKYQRAYQFLMDVVAPVMPSRRHLEFLAAQSGIVLNIGSGNSKVAPGVTNVDMFDYDNVDIVSDIHRLPFADASVDGVMSIAVLEHVRNPAEVVKEIERVLKPGGGVFTVIPFMQPFHASPHDYQRYTLPGLEWMHQSFSKVDSGVYGGPVSGMLWVVQETIAMSLSFGSSRLRNVIALGLMAFTWPLKFFDLVFGRWAVAQNVASSFYFWGRKPDHDQP